MADQVKAPPVKKQKNAFGNTKKPDIIIFRLVKQNDTTLRPDTETYPPYRRFPNVDIISWNWGTENEPDWRERAIRWLPGYQSIFVDEQESNGRVIPQQVLDNPSNKFEIIRGEIKVRPHENTKLKYLRICNRNVNSPNRTGRVQGLFEEYSEDKVIEALSTRQEMQQEAIDKAFSASEDQIAFHAKYLGVSMIDPATSSSRTFKAVRADYRQMAINDPERFLKTFDDDDLRLKYFIGKAIEDNLINLNLIPGKIIWTATKEEVCDIPAGSTAVESLFNFCQLKAGEDTLQRIKEHNK